MAQTLEHWIDRLQTEGRYTFLRQEADRRQRALRRSGEEGSAPLGQAAAHRQDQGLLLRDRASGISGGREPPATWFVGDLMGAMKLPYYVGLLSARGHARRVASAAPGIPSRH